MTTTFKPGDDVITPHSCGTIIEVRATASGKWVYGVEDATGEVRSFTSKALRLASN